MTREEVWYVYGVVRAGFDPGRAPAGVEDSEVGTVSAGSVAALASRVPAAAYDPAVVEAQSGDVSWLSPRAMAHDRVLTWAQEHRGVLPFPMFSLWRTESALTRALDERSARLVAAFDRVGNADEFGVRVHRRDDVMAGAIDTLDPELAAARSAARGASPGQRYLLERKLAEAEKAAVRAAGRRMAQAVFDELRALARDAVARPLTPEAGRAPEATLVLNGAFLVDRDRIDAFRAAVGAHVRADQPRGLTFDFTGPWPPYHFVGGDDGASLSGGSHE